MTLFIHNLVPSLLSQHLRPLEARARASIGRGVVWASHILFKLDLCHKYQQHYMRSAGHHRLFVHLHCCFDLEKCTDLSVFIWLLSYKPEINIIGTVTFMNPFTVIYLEL